MDTNTWIIGCHNESAEGKRRNDIDLRTFKEISILTPTQLMDKVEKAEQRSEKRAIAKIQSKEEVKGHG
ncbi:MAG: hypothetical protein ACWGNK_05345 [Desulfobacterales bacterium]